VAKTFCEWSLEQVTPSASGFKQIAPSASGISSGVANGDGGRNKICQSTCDSVAISASWSLEQKAACIARRL
jgi:hypothetical protein